MPFGNALGGIRINRKMRVLDSTSVEIEGLYAAGASVFGVAGFGYSSDYPSTKQGFCCYSGREAARIIAASI